MESEKKIEVRLYFEIGAMIIESNFVFLLTADFVLL